MATPALLAMKARRPQVGLVRRGGARPSGVVVLHTAENATTFTGPDTGAESVLRFILSRPDPGSYHVLCDADSTVYLAPWAAECWHDTRTNPHSVGISAAVRSGDWDRLGLRGDVIVRRMAAAAREYAAWLFRTRGVVIPARRITRPQALAGVPGFIGHGEIDIGRRTDPGRDFNWPLFLAAFASGAQPVSDTRPVPARPLPTPGGSLPTPIPPTEEDIVASLDELRDLLRTEVPAAVWEHRVAGGETAGGNLGSIRSEVASVPGAVLAAQVGGGGSLSEWVESIRADMQRADAVTRAQLAALTTALDALATSRGVDPESVRADVRAALSGLTLTLTSRTEPLP